MDVLICERLMGIINEGEDMAMKAKIFFLSPFTTKNAGKMPKLDISFSNNEFRVLRDMKRSCSKY